MKRKIKSTAKPFLVEGKTWWYTNSQCAIGTIDEFGLRIGSPTTLEGYGEELWYPVQGILERKFIREGLAASTGNWSEFNDKVSTFAWMSEKDNKIFTLINPESSKLRYDGIAISPYTSDTPFQVYDFGEIGNKFELGILPNETISMDIIGEEETINSGFTRRKLLSSPTPGYGEHSWAVEIPRYNYIEEIGHIQVQEERNRLLYQVFFCPLVPMISYTLRWDDAQLRYVTDKDDNIIYEGIGGSKLWEEYRESGLGGSVSDIVNDVEECQWFNLQGQPIVEPCASGVYICKQRGNVRKVAVKNR